MEAIKQIVRTPRNHEIRIKIPSHVPVNEPVEIVVFFRKKPKEYDRKIAELKAAQEDELFLSDLQEIANDFENMDLQDWQG